MKFIKISLVIILFISVVFIHFSCTCSNCNSNNEPGIIPEYIISKADSFVISKTGEEFFNEYFRIDLQRSSHENQIFHLFYNFRMLNPDFVDEEVNFFIDEKGDVIDSLEVTGIPNCLVNPTGCIFYIYENEAIEIARNEGLSEGIKDWLVSFRWSSELELYVWYIISTEREIGEGDFYKAAGKEIIINPSDGSILKFRRWNID